MNAIIVNPMPEARKHLSKLLRIFCQNVTIVDCADNAIDGIELVKTLDPDLIFIDVKVFNKENCSLTNNYLSEKVHTVFTLNNIDQLAKIGLDSADYLLTPTNPESLTKCVQRAHLKLRKQLFPNFKATSKDKTERIGIPTSKGIKYIALGEIIYLKAHNNYTEIFQEKGKPILIPKALKSFEQLLSGTLFSRVHQSYLVNLEKVVELQRIDGWLLILENNSKIPISRAKKSTIKKRLEQTWRMI